MDSLDSLSIFVFALTGLASWALCAVPYALGLVLVNVVYRVSSGRFFRWFSKATLLPYFLLLPVSILVSYFLWSRYSGPT